MTKLKQITLALVLMASFGNLATGEPDERLHADGNGWRLDRAKIIDEGRPRVLLIGDSILNGYLRDAIKGLAGKAYVDAWVNPHHQSEPLNKLLADVLASGPYDVVHFNMGLHGWPEGRIKVGTFKPLTKAYVEVLRRRLPRARFIWASSTPVTAEGDPENFDVEINPIIVEHNRMAAEVMKEMNVPVNDLYALLEDKRELAKGDRFHWTRPAYPILAKAVVGTVLRELGQDGPFIPVGSDRETRLSSPQCGAVIIKESASDRAKTMKTSAVGSGGGDALRLKLRLFWDGWLLFDRECALPSVPWIRVVQWINQNESFEADVGFDDEIIDEGAAALCELFPFGDGQHYAEMGHGNGVAV